MENSANPDLDHLRTELRRFAADHFVKTWCLAYSGGVDSQVLLHLLSGFNLELHAIYIDHGLQPASAQWAEHCRASCRQLGVPFQVIAVDASPRPRESPEAAARRARYDALATQIQTGDCLLTAQHQDDQAETLMLQLLRGAGAGGLAAMPRHNRFANGWHLRPLLDWSRAQILQYARQHHLQWVEDPSNQSSQYDRNFLRNEIFPLLRQHWPSLHRTLARAAALQGEQAALLTQLARLDAAAALGAGDCLRVDALHALNPERGRNLVRYWIVQRGHSLPSTGVMRQIMIQMLSEREDAEPVVSWAGSEVRRYRGALYLLHRDQPIAVDVLDWSVEQPIWLPGVGLLQMIEDAHGLDRSALRQPVQIRFRRGGERIKPAGRNAHHGLKNLFQEAGVPPWLRDRIPLLFKGDELIAVVGYWIADEYVCRLGDAGLSPRLTGTREDS